MNDYVRPYKKKRYEKDENAQGPEYWRGEIKKETPVKTAELPIAKHRDEILQTIAKH